MSYSILTKKGTQINWMVLVDWCNLVICLVWAYFFHCSQSLLTPLLIQRPVPIVSARNFNISKWAYLGGAYQNFTIFATNTWLVFFRHVRKLPSCHNWFFKYLTWLDSTWSSCNSSNFNCKWTKREKREKIASNGYLFAYLFYFHFFIACLPVGWLADCRFWFCLYSNNKRWLMLHNIMKRYIVVLFFACVRIFTWIGASVLLLSLIQAHMRALVLWPLKTYEVNTNAKSN